jgi:hypothetical protein
MQRDQCRDGSSRLRLRQFTDQREPVVGVQLDRFSPGGERHGSGDLDLGRHPAILQQWWCQ